MIETMLVAAQRCLGCHRETETSLIVAVAAAAAADGESCC